MASLENDAENSPFLEFRGHQLGIEQIPNAMLHLYRAQVGRSDVWRGRLDSSTNWAVVTSAAALTVTFSEPSGGDMLIPICTLLVTLFLGIEARRYRYYELWSSRVHLMEEAYFARLLSPTLSQEPEWTSKLAQSLRRPRFTISIWEALGRRYRRIYVWLYIVLGLAWIVHVCVHPVPAETIAEVLERPVLGHAQVGVMAALGLVFNGAIFIIGLLTRNLKEARGEVLTLQHLTAPEEPETKKSASQNQSQKPAK